jgi:hypothetical protein
MTKLTTKCNMATKDHTNNQGQQSFPWGTVETTADIIT